MDDAQVNTLHYWLYGPTSKTVDERRADLRERWDVVSEATLLLGVHLSLDWLIEIGVLPPS